MGNFAENLNLGNRFRPPLFASFRVWQVYSKPKESLQFSQAFFFFFFFFFFLSLKNYLFATPGPGDGVQLRQSAQRLLTGKFLLTYREKRGKEKRESEAEKKDN